MRTKWRASEQEDKETKKRGEERGEETTEDLEGSEDPDRKYHT